MSKLINGINKSNSLQYLRALSTLAVVMTHTEGDINKYWQSTGEIKLFSWGYYCVPMFFCISGFVISYSGYLRPKKWQDFVYSRLSRIYPVYNVIALIFIFCIILFPAGTFNNVPVVSIEKIGRTLLFDFGRVGGYVYVGWTLFYEMVFYFCFAFFVFRFPIIAKSKYFYYAIASGLILCYLFTMTRIADFLFGISAFLIVSNSVDKSVVYSRYVLLSSLSLGVIFHPVGFFCGVIILLLMSIEKLVPSMFRFKPILFLADSSYSIYLIQVLTVSASIKVARWALLLLPEITFNYLFFYLIVFVISLSSTIALGILMWKYIEKPSYKYLLSLRNKSNSPL